jgi:hypothetical protein
MQFDDTDRELREWLEKVEQICTWITPRVEHTEAIDDLFHVGMTPMQAVTVLQREAALRAELAGLKSSTRKSPMPVRARRPDQPKRPA